MGQKVHPESMRVGYIHDWKSHWFTEKHFADYLHEDTRIRSHIENRLSHAGISSITIRKDANEVEINATSFSAVRRDGTVAVWGRIGAGVFGPRVLSLGFPLNLELD